MQAWRASSAYLYILQLDGSALAWEYLRRNPDYRAQWRAGQLENDSVAIGKWGCRVADDPALDARAARPSWISEPSEIVRITALDLADVEQKFHFWMLPHPRDLTHRGTHLELHMGRSWTPFRVYLDDSVKDGESFAFVIRADKLMRVRMESACRLADVCNRKYPARNTPKNLRATRNKITHARSLQALDGKTAGASHREIAAAIFGAAEVAKRWSPDSELRAQVRYLLRRGRGFVNGGYRSLLTDGEP